MYVLYFDGDLELVSNTVYFLLSRVINRCTLIIIIISLIMNLYIENDNSVWAEPTERLPGMTEWAEQHSSQGILPLELIFLTGSQIGLKKINVTRHKLETSPKTNGHAWVFFLWLADRNWIWVIPSVQQSTKKPCRKPLAPKSILILLP